MIWPVQLEEDARSWGPKVGDDDVKTDINISTDQKVFAFDDDAIGCDDTFDTVSVDDCNM